MSAPPRPAESAEEALAGLVERVTFHNPENGFCVLRVKARGQRELVTVVGHAPTINAGEWITATGRWVNDAQHGLQFKASYLSAAAPGSREGILRYLSSGLIRGIGPVFAQKLVDAFLPYDTPVNSPLLIQLSKPLTKNMPTIKCP
jgi:exodeoxyribonuclease V alpha subunit